MDEKAQESRTLEVIPANPSGFGGIERLDPGRIQELIAQKKMVDQLIAELMEPGVDYGIVPGTDKPTLYQSGAEKLCQLFNLRPEWEKVYDEIDTGRPDDEGKSGHFSVLSICRLYSMRTDKLRGEGRGRCSTREAKYAYRRGSMKCPACDKETIRKSKAEDQGAGFYCWSKIGGCGRQFREADENAEVQAHLQVLKETKVGRVPNEDLADTYNTVEKMADKRSFVAAVKTATGTSARFTQDMEDAEETGEEAPRGQRHRQQQGRPQGRQQSQSGQQAQGEGQEAKGFANQKQIGRLFGIAKGVGWERETVIAELRRGGIEDEGKIPLDRYERVVEFFRKAPGVKTESNGEHRAPTESDGGQG